MKTFKSPFTFLGENHQFDKTKALCCVEEQQLCTVDTNGKPSAIFTHIEVSAVPCVRIFKPITPKVLGSQRDERLLLEHKPVMRLEHLSR